MSLSLKIKVDKKRKRISIKDPTPNLSKLEDYAEDKRRIYPKLTTSLTKLRQFVGANEVKECVAKQAQFIIMNQMAKRPQRRSTRKRRKTGRLQIGRNTLRGGKRPRLDTEELESEEDEEFDTAFPDDIPEGFKGAAFGAMIALALAQHGMEEESDSEDEEEDAEMQLRYKKPDYMKGIHTHTMLLGKPGTGKTTLAHILVDIWDSLGIVDKKRYFQTTRGDWVGKYQGHSVAKAKKLIKQARGGVIFIDEAYSLIAAKDGDDAYGHEVLTEIVESMTDPDKNVTFIFAGYEQDMSKLFGANKGLRRRFGYIYKLKQPDALHLFLIFQKQLKEHKWKVPKSERANAVMFFQQHKEIFEWGGGSTENFIQHAKQSAISRLFPIQHDKKILMADLKEAHRQMVMHNKSTDPIPPHIKNMYL
jgi:SpoVK/Ycf46/Vps4 family AAA+-type ATPase